MVNTNHNKDKAEASDKEELYPMDVKNICKVCKNRCKRDQNSLKCLCCDDWKHVSCMGANAEECEFLCKVKLDIGWICLECKEGKKGVMKENRDLKRKNIQLEKDVEAAKQMCMDLKKEASETIKQMESQLKVGRVNENEVNRIECIKENEFDYLKYEMMEKIMGWKKECIDMIENNDERRKRDNDRMLVEMSELTNEVKKIVHETDLDGIGKIEEKLDLRREITSAIKEEESRKEKKKNLVIYNVPESKKLKWREREAEDEASINDLLKVGVKEERYKIHKVIRLGKREETCGNNRLRPLMVRLQDETQKWDILKQARNLKYAVGWHKKVGIAEDLTRDERREQKERRCMMNEKRDSGELGWYIRNRGLH